MQGGTLASRREQAATKDWRGLLVVHDGKSTLVGWIVEDWTVAWTRYGRLWSIGHQ